MRETTALGAAIAAGFAVDVWKDFSELKNINREGRQIFKPEISEKESGAMFALWSKAVEMCRGWVSLALVHLIFLLHYLRLNCVFGYTDSFVG